MQVPKKHTHTHTQHRFPLLLEFIHSRLLVPLHIFVPQTQLLQEAVGHCSSKSSRHDNNTHLDHTHSRGRRCRQKQHQHQHHHTHTHHPLQFCSCVPLHRKGPPPPPKVFCGRKVLCGSKSTLFVGETAHWEVQGAENRDAMGCGSSTSAKPAGDKPISAGGGGTTAPKNSGNVCLVAPCLRSCCLCGWGFFFSVWVWVCGAFLLWATTTTPPSWLSTASVWIGWRFLSLSLSLSPSCTCFCLFLLSALV